MSESNEEFPSLPGPWSGAHGEAPDPTLPDPGPLRPTTESPIAAKPIAPQTRRWGRSRPVMTATRPRRIGVAVTKVTDAAMLVSVRDVTQVPKWSA